MSKSKIYVFTLNNPKSTLQEVADQCKSIGATAGAMQLEKGEEGTPHVQGFIKFDNARHFKKVKKSLPDGAHIESAKHAFKSW